MLWSSLFTASTEQFHRLHRFELQTSRPAHCDPSRTRGPPRARSAAPLGAPPRPRHPSDRTPSSPPQPMRSGPWPPTPPRRPWACRQATWASPARTEGSARDPRWPRAATSGAARNAERGRGRTRKRTRRRGLRSRWTPPPPRTRGGRARWRRAGRPRRRRVRPWRWRTGQWSGVRWRELEWERSGQQRRPETGDGVFVSPGRLGFSPLRFKFELRVRDRSWI